MKRLALLAVGLMTLSGLKAVEWQWSVATHGIVSSETGHTPRAFLWIPPMCDTVRAVVVGQHNMSEETLFENRLFREAMARENFAVVWISPILDMPWDVNTGCQQTFDRMLNDLAATSGYDELRTAPIVPVGHSALATFPWNFAAWNPQRTLAVVSLHGDAPRTRLTGYGGPNLEWGRTRNIDGIPGLMVEGEYEWWEERIIPALAFKMAYPQSCISFFGDAGRGHFDVADRTASYIAQFLHKAAALRLGTPLKAVDPADGWLAARWHPGQKRPAKAAPQARYKGNKHEAFWYFDGQMAELTEHCYAASDGKQPAFIGYEQQGELRSYDANFHARMQAKFLPEADGITFHLKALFTDSLRQHPAADRPAGKPVVSRICGPIEMVDDTTFRVAFYRMGTDNTRRTAQVWIMAEHPGDKHYKSAVQQIVMDIPYRNREGRRQAILFASLSDIAQGAPMPALEAVSDCGLPVCYYVKEGPARIERGQLVATELPPRAKLPIRITVAAWQYGIAGQVQTAQTIERHFYITK